MAEVEALYLKSQEKERAAEAKTTAQNRNLYGGYMQEIDPYGEFAEKIAKKGLTKSGYPQYDYEGFKKAFEAQAGDNMQNLRQLKAEIRAALQLAIATENEKLEEALLNYRTNLTKLEQEYMGDGVKQEGRMTLSPQEVVDKAVSYSRIAKQGEEEGIKNLDELPNDREWTNLLLRRTADDDSGIELQRFSYHRDNEMSGYITGKKKQVLDFAEDVLMNGREVTVEDIEELQRDLSLVEDDEEVIVALEALMLNDGYLKAVNEYMNRDEDVDYRQGIIGSITAGVHRIADIFNRMTIKIPSVRSMFNYKYNIGQGDLPKYINGQELGEIADYKYGNSTMAQSGCGVIAAYNAISILGGVPNMPELIRYFEQNGMVMNAALGTNPYSIGNYFKGNGYEVENITHNLDKALTENNVVILTSWNNAENILQGSHTVAIKKDKDGRVLVYNPYSNKADKDDFDTIKDYLEGRSLITAAVITNNAETEDKAE